MARRRRGRGRGISPGTVVIIAICVLTLVLAGVIFARISGNMEEISIDPGLLAEPLTLLLNTPETGGMGFYAGGNEDITLEDLIDQELEPEDTPLPVITEQPVATATPTPEPTAPPTRPITISAAGIVAMNTELRVSGKVDNAGVYDYTSIFAPVAAAMQGADLSIVTLRTSLGAVSGSYDAYRAPYELAGALKVSGVNLLNFGTDRLLDHGMQGVTETRDIVRDLGLSTAGLYTSAEEYAEPAIHDLDGVKVGVLSFTTSVSAGGKKAVSPEELGFAIRTYDAAMIKADIDALREAGANVVVVLANWGSKSDAAPSTETKAIADTLVAAGADVILGTNPSSVHEMEKRTVATSGGASREVIIAYSLGNFLNDESRETPAISGVVLQLTIEWDAQAQRATYEGSWYMPTWIMRWKDAGGTHRYRIVPSGASTKPADMQQSLYDKVQKNYQSMITKLGTDVLAPRPEP